MPVNTGLPEQTRLSIIYPAPDGYVYFGSGSALYRFTGLNSELIGAIPDENQNFTAIISYRNELWLGSSSGAIYILRKDRLLKFKPEEGLPSAGITSFAIDSFGQLWIGTNGEGVYCWTDKRLYQFGLDDGLPDAVINSLHFWQNTMWAGTDGGLVQLSFRQRQKKVTVFTTENGLPDNIVTHIQSYNDQLLLGFQSTGLGVFTGKKFISWQETNKYGVVGMTLAQNELWWVSDDQSLHIYDFLQKRQRLVPLQIQGKKARIDQMVADQSGTMWWLTSQGIFRHTLALQRLPIAESGVQAVLIDHQHRLWYSTREGLFMRNGNAETVRLNLNTKAANIISLFEDDNNMIWAGCFGSGLWSIHPVSLAVTHFNEKNGLENGNIFSITQQNDSLLLGTLGGVYSASLKSNKMTFYPDQLEGGPGAAYIFQLKSDRQKNLWVATDGAGLYRKSKTSYTKVNPTNPPARTFTGIAEDKYGHVWFSAPQHGLYRYHGDSLQYIPLRSPEIAAIASIGDYLYAAHPQGIDRIHIKSQQSFHWGKTQGLEQLEPYTNAIYQGKYEIWLGGQQELIRIRDIQQKNPGPRLKLVELLINGQKHDSSWHELDAAENQVTFSFDALWYEDPEAIHYRYKLEGYGKEWVNTRNQEVTFPRLPPGKYAFHLEAAVDDSFSGATKFSWNFTINKPFYLQWWFILAAAIAFFALVYNYLRTRDKRLKKQSQVMQEKVQAQFETLKSQVSPHFLFNSFNTLLSLIESNPQKAAVYVEHLSDLFRNILKYRERDLITVNEELELIQAYAYLQEQRFGDNFKLEIILDVAIRKSLIPPLTLQLLVENAIKHNIISTDKPLLVQIRRRDNFLLVTNPLQPKPNPETSTGFGLRSIRDRYKLLSSQDIQISELDNQFQISLPLLYAL